MLTLSELEKARETIFSLGDFSSFPGRKMVCAYAFLNKTKYFAFNNKKTHPANFKVVARGVLCCSHAEVASVARVPRQSRERLRLFIFRFLKNGNLSMAKPCANCTSFLLNEGISLKNVFFTNWFGKWERLG